jgi:hypothetical protein
VCFLLFYKNLSLNSGQHPERIKRFSIETYGEITFRLTNVIPERIIFVSRGITVVETARGFIMDGGNYNLPEVVVRNLSLPWELVRKQVTVILI